MTQIHSKRQALVATSVYVCTPGRTVKLMPAAAEVMLCGPLSVLLMRSRVGRPTLTAKSVLQNESCIFPPGSFLFAPATLTSISGELGGLGATAAGIVITLLSLFPVLTSNAMTDITSAARIATPPIT